MCVSIKPGAPYNVEQIEVPNFKQNAENKKVTNFTLSNEKYVKTSWRGLQLYVSPERKSG